MIHNVKRDEIRMVGGEVHIVDPLEGVRAMAEIRPSVRALIERIDPMIGDVPGGWFAAYAYDRMESVLAGEPVAIVVRNITSITSRTVQIEAPEDVTFPVPED